MTEGASDYLAIERHLAGLGLVARGGFHPRTEDGVPALPDGRAAGTLVIVGNAGPALWRVFAAAPEAAAGAPDPLNRWSERVLGDLAGRFGGRALYPFGGPPYWPFVAWAKRAEAVWESPLGMLIHPDYGLWHAYRGALALPERIALPPRRVRAKPCETCSGKPCLSACPVGAFTPAGCGPASYDVAACAGHVGAPAGADCLGLGCRARRACPIGRDYLYDGAQARFHMEAFLAARQREMGRRETGKR
ncbi:MAG: ferredoxin [Kiloniellales bacterium]